MKLTLLIADADTDSALQLAKALQNNRQVRTVLTASKPDEILAKAEAADLILMDPLLPDTDGTSLLRTMLTNGIQPGVIVLSAFYSPELLKELDALGVTHCMYKPVDLDLLSQRITDWHIHGGSHLGTENPSLQRQITTLLHELGMAPISGYYDCRLGLEWMLRHGNSRGSITKELYPFLAKRTHQSATQVERNIRYAIERAWLIGDPEILERYFGYSVGPDRSRPSNAAFLRTLAEYLRQSGHFPDGESSEGGGGDNPAFPCHA